MMLTQNSISSSFDHTTFSTKGQLVIPKEMRQRIQWAAGDSLQLRLEGDEIRVRRVESVLKKHALSEVAGCLKGSSLKKLSSVEVKKRIGSRLRAAL